MSQAASRRHRAGEPISDVCRACKATRGHTVMAVDAEGRVLRVVCDFCGSQHNFRGGAGLQAEPRPGRPEADSGAEAGPAGAEREPLPLVSERERTGLRMSANEGGGDLELLLRRVIREELGLTPVVPAERWRGGELVLRPGKPGLQDKTWPIETFFHKVVMIRNRLRALEQQINSADLPEDAKVRLQSYITGCYGSLTSFNLLFADEDDQFRGAGGAE